MGSRFTSRWISERGESSDFAVRDSRVAVLMSASLRDRPRGLECQAPPPIAATPEERHASSDGSSDALAIAKGFAFVVFVVAV